MFVPFLKHKTEEMKAYAFWWLWNIKNPSYDKIKEELLKDKYISFLETELKFMGNNRISHIAVLLAGNLGIKKFVKYFKQKGNDEINMA